MDGDVIELLDRRLYAMAQVDRLLGLHGGTARRWIDGYRRGAKAYPPVVRIEATGEEIVTWGEFVETRLLAEYRDAGISLVRMRPAVERLRELFHETYPLAHAQPYIDVKGRELVLEMQQSVGLERELQLVVIRNDQLVLTDPAERFRRAAKFRHNDGVVEQLHPVTEVEEVVIDPLLQFGEPVVQGRRVSAEIILEQVRAGEPHESIAELYELPRPTIEAVVRYGLIRSERAAA